MGYHVSILRTRNGQQVPITKAEIEKLVESAPSLLIKPSSLGDADLDLVVSQDNRDISRLTLQRGKLWTTNPQDSEIQAMLDIAAQLDARVRGDEFETFRTPTETFFHPDDKREIECANDSIAKIRKAVRRKQWVLNLVIITLFTTLAVIVAHFSKR